MMKGNIKDIIENLMEGRSEVVKTTKMTEKEIKDYRAYDALCEERLAVEKKKREFKLRFWNKIEGRLDVFDKKLKVDTDKWEIQEFAEDRE